MCVCKRSTARLYARYSPSLLPGRAGLGLCGNRWDVTWRKTGVEPGWVVRQWSGQPMSLVKCRNISTVLSNPFGLGVGRKHVSNEKYFSLLQG